VDAAPVQRTGRAAKIAYKTGTSYGFRDAWAVGYDGAFTIGVWVGRADGTPLPDRYGRGVAAPILFKLFDLLPDSKSGAAGPAVPAKPADALDVPHGKLPPNLRRYAPKSAPLASRGGDGTTAAAAPVQIAFPPAGATVELEPRADGARYLPLAAEGGRVPLRWIVNGTPLDGQGGRRQAFWRPDSAGFVQVTVIDADGRSASVEARVK
jgi:penicillin-binding protein 1C